MRTPLVMLTALALILALPAYVIAADPPTEETSEEAEEQSSPMADYRKEVAKRYEQEVGRVDESQINPDFSTPEEALQKNPWAKDALAYRHRDGVPRIDDIHSPDNALGGGHRHPAHHTSAKVLLDLEGQRCRLALVFIIDVQRLVNGGDVLGIELYVNNGAEHLDDLSCILTHDDERMGLSLKDGLGIGSGRGDFEDFLGNACLAGLVILQGQ